MSNHFKKERRVASAAGSTQGGAHLESAAVEGLYHEFSKSGMRV